VREIVAITKALADESRLRILASLRGGELCLCQLVEVLGLAPSTVSKHVELLWRAGLVERRKDGRWRYYRLVGPAAPTVVLEAIRWISSSLATAPAILADEVRLQAIRATAPSTLTGCYSRVAATRAANPTVDAAGGSDGV
jgi:DNA-binding transcriptional ArsR family regulator